MTRGLRRALAAAATIAVFGGAASTADAHYTYWADRDAALTRIRHDCGRAWDWVCSSSVYNFYFAGYAGDHSTGWDGTYNETRLYLPGTKRTCHTFVRASHGSVVWSTKTCY